MKSITHIYHPKPRIRAFRYTRSNHPKRKKISALATFTMVALLIVAVQAQARASAGWVSAIVGAVTVERAGRSIPAADGTAVEVGDKLTTGPKSRITINLADGSQLQLSESSSLVVTENTLNADGSRASTKVTLMD